MCDLWRTWLQCLEICWQCLFWPVSPTLTMPYQMVCTKPLQWAGAPGIHSLTRIMRRKWQELQIPLSGHKRITVYNEVERLWNWYDLFRLGLDKYGYNILTVDDFWNLPERDENGRMIVNTERYTVQYVCVHLKEVYDAFLKPWHCRFPNGMKHLGDYLHNKSLKFGIYSDAGSLTCGGCAGSLGHEKQDIEQFLEFGIDFLKYDNCYPNVNRIFRNELSQFW